MGSRRAMLIAAVTIAAVLAVGSGDASTSAAPIRAASPTSGCVAMDGTSVAAGGPSRATVVVDTGAGAVWSACISFSGSITGIDALERAEATIVDLDPVYDQYTGLGRAVCRLRGVGSDPPDCLGKAADYWSFSVNGRVASVGAGALSVRDGDVHGWAYGAGGAPRVATMGSRASSAPPPTTSTTAVAQRPSPTVPSAGPAPASPQTPTSSPGSPGEPGDGSAMEATTPEASSGSTTTAVGPDEQRQGAAAEGEGRSDEADTAGPASGEEDELAVAAASSAGSEGSAGGGGGSSGAGSLLGFGAALAAVGVAGVWARRRRVGAAA